MIYLDIQAFSAQAPADNLDNEFQFPMVPNGDQIVAATVTSDTESMTISNIVIIGTSVICWVTGGTPGATATLTCQATTIGGRIYNRSGTMPIRSLI
jgi:hypothetical protein